MTGTKKVRAELQRYYTLTNQFRVQLQALDESVPGVRVEIREVPPPEGDADGDIMALAFIVMMEANKSAQEDLRAVMKQVKAISAQKKKVRAALKQRSDRGLDSLSVASLISAVTAKAETSRIIDEIGSMSEMDGMESLRLQMAMDRMSKMMSTLSNILKKMSCTASQITQNMK